VTQSAGEARKTTPRRPNAKQPKPKEPKPREPKPRAPESKAEAHAPGGRNEDHVCNVAFCPIGLALTAADRVQPDVVAHLLVAGREFFLAAKAVMDARADDLRDDGPSEGPARMERIDIG
jgi:hypothetical protein